MYNNQNINQVQPYTDNKYIMQGYKNKKQVLWFNANEETVKDAAQQVIEISNYNTGLDNMK